jgi:hypothetical protein
MVEEIITALSRFKGLFVIARNSSFTFKGKARFKPFGKIDLDQCMAAPFVKHFQVELPRRGETADDGGRG